MALVLALDAVGAAQRSRIGREHGIEHHLRDGDEFKLPLAELLRYGEQLFAANWTEQDGVGRPLSKGNGRTLTDRTERLVGLRTFNRLSGPDANSCAGCHRGPFNVPGGGGEFVSNAFEGAERFDFVTFDRHDERPTRGALDERRQPATLQTVGNPRLPPDLLGAGYLEAVAREMTLDLRRIRNSMAPGQSKALSSKGVSFGVLARRPDGAWDAGGVTGLPAQSVRTAASTPPTLVIRPWGRAGTFVSIRDITVRSYNQHLGIQATERFGVDTDPDGDGVTNEITRADVAAVALFQATVAPPGRVIPRDPSAERAARNGERVFAQAGCASCHIPALPLARATYSEPGPFNPQGNVRASQARVLSVNLSDASLPGPRLATASDALTPIAVPAYTDFKLHDITDPADASSTELLDLNEPEGSATYFAGNRRFITRRLWSVGNQSPYWHDGRFTTIGEAVLAHAGEALESRRAFERLPSAEQEALLAFLSSLQALPPAAKALVLDERLEPRDLPK